MKTIAILVDTEGATWERGGPSLLEAVTLGAPVVLPGLLSAEGKLDFARKVLGDSLRPVKTHQRSVTIGGARDSDAEFLAIQFFDVEETISLEEAIKAMREETGL